MANNKIDWDNISACSGRDSRFPVIKLGLAGKEKGPFRRINLGNEYEDIVAAMRSRAIELLTEGASDLISSTTLDSFKVTLKYQDTDGEECIIMSRDEVHDAVAQYEGCSSVKVFATVEEMKPTVEIGKELSLGNLRILQTETEVEVASLLSVATESREDHSMADNRSRGVEARGAAEESREDVDSFYPRTDDNRRSKKMMLPKTTAMAAKKSMAIQKRTTPSRSRKTAASPSSDLASVHAIHTGKNNASPPRPPRTISTRSRTVGRHPKTARKSQQESSNDKSVSSSRSSSRRRLSPPSSVQQQDDDSFESGRSSKSALFLRAQASPTVTRVPATKNGNDQQVKPSLRLQKIDGNNKQKLVKLEKIDAAPTSFKILAPKKVLPKPVVVVPVPTKEEVRSAISSSPVADVVAENRGGTLKQEVSNANATLPIPPPPPPRGGTRRQQAGNSTAATPPPPPASSVTTTTMPSRPRKQVAEIVNMLQAKNASLKSSFSSSSRAKVARRAVSKVKQPHQQPQQDRCTPTPSEGSSAAVTEKTRNSVVLSGGNTRRTTTKFETKQQQQPQQQPSTTIANNNKTTLRVDDLLAMSGDNEHRAAYEQTKQRLLQLQHPPSSNLAKTNDKKKNELSAEQALAMNSSCTRSRGEDKEESSAQVDTEEEDDGEDESSAESRMTTPTTSEDDDNFYEEEEEEEEISTGSSILTYDNKGSRHRGGKDAEAFSLNSILAGFYSF